MFAMKINLKLILMLMLMSCSIKQSAAQTSDVQPADTNAIAVLAKLDMEEMEIDRLVTIPGMGLFMNIGDGEYKSLDRERCPDFEKFMLLDNMWYDQLVATENRFLVRNGRQVYEIDKTKSNLIADFDTPCFRIFAGNDSIFYMVVYVDDGSSIYSCNLADGKVKPLVTLQEDILRIESMGKGFMFIAGNTMYYADGTELNRLFDTEEPLADMVLTQHGLLFCTETSLYMYDGESIMPLSSDSFLRLFHDNGRTYIIVQDGTIYYFDM